MELKFCLSLIFTHVSIWNTHPGLSKNQPCSTNHSGFVQLSCLPVAVQNRCSTRGNNMSVLQQHELKGGQWDPVNFGCRSQMTVVYMRAHSQMWWTCDVQHRLIEWATAVSYSTQQNRQHWRGKDRILFERTEWGKKQWIGGSRAYFKNITSIMSTKFNQKTGSQITENTRWLYH